MPFTSPLFAAARLDVPVAHWVIFSSCVLVLLLLDMFVFHRKAHEPTLRESAMWTAFWMSLAAMFNVWIGWHFGRQTGMEFLLGYVVEWSLSMDNVFVFVVIFTYFQVPLKYQYRVLFWGILGAIVMRLTFIVAAAALLENFQWMMYVFGAILLVSGLKLGFGSQDHVDPDRNVVIRIARKYLPVAKEFYGDRFFVRENGKRCVTTLFLVLLVVESTDVVFAVDSVPAIFGITQEPFVVFTSNVFAIMGLRALYFLLAGVMDRFRYLHYGLSAVLCFIGIKMIIKDFWHPEPWVSLVVIAGLLATSIIASQFAPETDESANHKDRQGRPDSTEPA